MSTHEQITNNPTSAVRNTGGRNGPQGLEEPMSDEILREVCDKNYHQLLPLIAEKMQKEKEQKDKLNAVKARLIYGEESGIKIRSREESHYSESKTPTARTEPRRRHGDRYSRSPSPHASVFKRLKKNRSPSPQPRPRKEGGVFNRLGRKEPVTSARSDSRRRSPQAKRTEVETRRRQQRQTPSRATARTVKEVTGNLSQEGRNQTPMKMISISLGHVRKEILSHYGSGTLVFRGTRMPSHVKTYDGSGDPEDHLKTAFRENYLQQTKHIKDPVEIHHIKQRDGESTEDFMERYKAEVLDVEGAPECMRISGFMHGITHPGLIKRLYERIPRSVDEMYRMTTSFLQGEVAALSHGRKKASSSWKPSEGGDKPTFKKGFKNKQRPDRKPDRFSLLTKTPKEIFALEKGKFKAPPPMVTPVEKRDPSKYCEFHSDTGHNTNECMQLRKQIDEMIKAGKLSQFIKELKQNDKPKAPKKGEASGKDKPLTILMIQPWERVAKPRITQSFSPETAMSFPPLSEEDGTESPMIIEVEMGGHFVHRVYIDGGASSEVLYEHCFVKNPKEIRDQMVPSTTHHYRIQAERPFGRGQKALLSIHPEYPEQTVAIGSTLTEKGRKELGSLLKQNLDIFAWKPADMTGVPRNIAEHRLNIREGYSPVRQKKKGQAPERNKAIQEEVEKLVDAGIMKEEYRSYRKFELEGYDIQYRPRTAIKGQILADFIVERPEEESPDELMAEPEVLPEPWTLFTDGSSCVDGSGAGLILINPEGAEFTYAMRFRFEATNNEAEYEALIAGLRIAEQMGVKNLQANVDSRLVANQVNGFYTAKESGMVQYLNKVKTLAKSFKEFSIKQIPRSENKKADALSKIASTSFAHLNKQVLVEELKEKSINEKEILDVVEEEGNTWMTPICEYLTKEILPEDKKKARAVRRKAVRYAMINGTLYKKSFLGPWLRCVGPLQANYVLREIHEGSCSMHSGPRSVVAKVIQTGYYWPTMHMDARNLIRECNDCQIHRPVPRNPQQNLTPITSPWPFYKWGIDIAGPFPEGPGKVKFLIVAIDYFTKWIEAKAVATITGNQVKKFVWDNIVCRFGLPGEIISDNGKQFRDNPFKDWCEKLCIRQCFASVKHPQANGLVERANRSLGEGIKARLEEKSKDWIEELPHVLWAHRTMIKSSNGETPFSLTYGTEAVIPAEIGMPTLRTAEMDQAKNNEALGINLDLIEERREQAAIQEAKSKKKMEKYYNSRVRGTSFKPGEMVYRSNEASHAKDGGKLGPKWEGPYEVKESLGKGAYKLKDRKGNDMPRTWNICNLKKCYIHEM
ncbi:reverse transcriptase domain-containing protein [Tanacetum coccineum]